MDSTNRETTKRPRVEDLDPTVIYKKKKKKRKKKPLKMTSFFAAATNFQGFPMLRCRYEPSIGDHVFVPEDYGGLSKLSPWRDQSFCSSCNLKPCIMVEHQSDISAAAVDEHFKQEMAEQEGK